MMSYLASFLIGTRLKIKNMAASLWGGNMTELKYLKNQLAHEGQ